VANGGSTAERSLTNIELATRGLRDIVGRQGTSAGDTIASLQDTLLSVQKSLGRIDNVVARVEEVVGGVARGEGNVGRLLKDETLIRQTEGVVTNAKQLLDRYTRLEVGLDYRIAAYAQRVQYSDALSWQSHLSLRLQPRPDRYVKATLTSDNIGKITTLRRTTNTSIDGAKSPGVTEQFTERENTFKLGLQYARRLGPITLRGGLIENTAGGGIDLHLWSDRLRIEADMFRFAELGLSRPRFRLGATLEFIQHVYAWVGGDDLFYPTARADFFYGVGIAFTDDDLKILFAAAPSISTK
jgi:phospholipid/cholesterol/gamma-HCH transport system substrate-binding protein